MSRDGHEQARRFDHEATEILSRYEGIELEEHASRWCDRHAAMLASPGFTLDAMGTSSRHIRNTKRLLTLAAKSAAGLALVASVLGPIAEDAHTPDCDAVLLVAALWSVRDDQEKYADALRAWSTRRSAQGGRECSRDPAGRLAYSLSGFPELAYALLDGSRAVERTCTSCRMAIGELWTARTALRVLAKVRSGAADLAVLAGVDDAIVLRDEVCRVSARELMADERAAPEQVTRAVEKALGGPDDELRHAALAVLLASPSDQQRAIGKLVELWQHSPGGAFQFLLRGACRGTGWGRPDLPTKLLPFTRLLWTPPVRGINPAGTLHYLHQLIADEADEDGWERVRECVGELLLQYVLDHSMHADGRLAALDAILVLQPGGNGSIVRALGKVKSDPLVGLRARDVQKQLKLAKRTTDGELAVQDAWIAFWRSTPTEQQS